MAVAGTPQSRAGASPPSDTHCFDASGLTPLGSIDGCMMKAAFPPKIFRSIARILAAGYLRYRARRRRENSLDVPPNRALMDTRLTDREGRTRGDRDAETD